MATRGLNLPDKLPDSKPRLVLLTSRDEITTPALASEVVNKLSSFKPSDLI